MDRSRWLPRSSPQRRTTTRDRCRAPRRLSTHAATGGLVAVLLLLTVFAVTAAVTNARASADVEQSAGISQWSLQAERSLALQEELVDRLAVRPDAELRTEYAATSAATGRAIEAMGSGAADDDPVEEWLRLHARYEYAVRLLLATAPRNRGGSEDFEDTYVDAHFDALEDRIQAEAQRQWDEAGESLESLRDVQQLLLVTTPVLFGVGLPQPAGDRRPGRAQPPAGAARRADRSAQPHPAAPAGGRRAGRLRRRRGGASAHRPGPVQRDQRHPRARLRRRRPAGGGRPAARRGPRQ